MFVYDDTITCSEEVMKPTRQEGNQYIYNLSSSPVLQMRPPSTTTATLHSGISKTLAVSSLWKVTPASHWLYTMDIEIPDFRKKKENPPRPIVYDHEYHQAIERENRYRNYLKEESQKLREKWERLAKKYRERSDDEEQKMRKSRKDTPSREEMYEKFAKMTDEQRGKAIQEVEEIIWRDEAKPLELQSAALLCEVLKVQQEQREEMKQAKMLSKETRVQAAQELQLQSQQWDERQRQRVQEEYRRATAYKKDLQALIEEREMRKQAEREQQMRIEQEIQQNKKKEMLKEQEETKKEFRMKRKIIHKHALEAIKIKEDMLKRDVMCDAIQDKMIQLYQEGKEKISDFMQTKRKEKTVMKESLKGKVASQFVKIQPRTKEIEEKLIRKALVDQEKCHVEKQEKAREVARKLESERCKAQKQEMESFQDKKLREKKERRLSVEKRLEIFHVTAKHHEMEVRSKVEAARRFRESLDRQVVEKRERERRERQEEIDFTNKVMVEDARAVDKTFGKFSERLVERATRKGEPLLPLERAKDAYRTLHTITRKPVLPHLLDRIPINPKPLESQ
ncbi:hypothetical protein DMENIID0001_109000 [Sergentomyia squamirostris]